MCSFSLFKFGLESLFRLPDGLWIRNWNLEFRGYILLGFCKLFNPLDPSPLLFPSFDSLFVFSLLLDTEKFFHSLGLLLGLLLLFFPLYISDPSSHFPASDWTVVAMYNPLFIDLPF